MEIKNIKIGMLFSNERNPRVHGKNQIKALVKSIKAFGFNNPLLIDRDNKIIAGHGRFMAAKEVGLKELPCIKLDHLSDSKKKAFIIADNNIALKSSWDYDILIDEIKEIDVGDIDTLGFSTREIKNFTDEGYSNDKADEKSIYHEWNDMPEYQSDNNLPIKSVIVHFYSASDIDDFFKLVNQKYTEKIKSISFPEQKINPAADKVYGQV
jgi:hypothetical protein